MLDKVKTALRIKTDAYDEELNDLIESAKLDLGVAGVLVSNDGADAEVDRVGVYFFRRGEIDALISKAIITYCKMSFGLPEDYDRLKRSYDEQKAQLSNTTGYTYWGEE